MLHSKHDECASIIKQHLQEHWASQVALVVKNLLANAGDIRDTGSIPGLGRSLLRAWQPTPILLPGESDRGDWRAMVQRVTKSQT